MKKKVIICVPCLLVGGTEVHTLALARALVAGGYRVTVCAYYEYDTVMVDEIERVGAKVCLLQLNRDSAGKSISMMPQLSARLAKLLLQEQPNFVHVQYMTPGIVPIAVARLCGVPRVFATIHVPGHHYGTKIYLPRIAARMCNVFLCVSEVAERSFFCSSKLFDKDLLRAGRRHFTIHNCVDLQEIDEIIRVERIDAKRRELRLDGHKVVGIIARISREKGHKWLLDAMRQVIQNMHSVKLLVVGDGVDKRALMTYSDKIGLNRNVIWIGRIPHKEALAYYGLMDVVAVPSEWEGFGLSAAEAMAFGKPVVASDVDGLQEVVSDQKTGLLVPCNDVNAMAHAICSLLSDRERSRYLGISGRYRVEQNFSMECFADKHLCLYSTLSSLC